MKLLATIFAVYLLTLSCMPCLCADECEPSVKQTAIKIPTKEKQQDDNCTPFCTCSCCHFTVINTVKFLPQANIFPDAALIKMFVTAHPDYSSYNCHNIWQPPKLIA